ncbi:hypothetical protein CDAR_618101 [Caerostris darwini]|uniref:Uncharacterized protein n=1 Tax=Caerostris darwini TaxID=1538125 RepID=A0AAV4U8T7_9ARAC|nr:hypothetical protein CDAR_618101 [Caerostris darwini]
MSRTKKLHPYPLLHPRDGPTQLISRTTGALAEEGKVFVFAEENLEKEKRGRTSGDKALLKRPGTPPGSKIKRITEINKKKTASQPPYSIPGDGPTQLISRTTDAEQLKKGTRLSWRRKPEKGEERENVRAISLFLKRPGTPRRISVFKEKHGKHS